MLATIAILTVAFGWLLFETDFLRVRLPCGKAETEQQILLLTTTIDNILMLPPAKQPSYFTPCDLDEPDFSSKTVINVGAKIL
jgi:hypothetical protein